MAKQCIMEFVDHGLAALQRLEFPVGEASGRPYDLQPRRSGGYRSNGVRLEAEDSIAAIRQRVPARSLLERSSVRDTIKKGIALNAHRAPVVSMGATMR
jgi:hypothetical protein